MTTRIEFWPADQRWARAEESAAVEAVEWPVSWEDVDNVPRHGDLVAFGERYWLVELVLWANTDQTRVSIRVRPLPDIGFDDPFTAAGFHRG